MDSEPLNPQLLLTPTHANGALAEPSASGNKTLSIHRWTNWIAGFSGEFARSAIRHYLPFPRSECTVMDPFAGIGTTLLEAYQEGFNSIGFELNPYAALVCKMKLSSPDIDLAALKQAVKHCRPSAIIEVDPKN